MVASPVKRTHASHVGFVPVPIMLGRSCWRGQSAAYLELLKAVQLLLDAGFVSARRTTSNPRPSLHQQLSVLAICLEVDRCNHLVAQEHR
jgi:hypothetical protein